MLEDNFEGSKEERTFRFWVNSLELEHEPVNDLYEDVKDGQLLLKVIDKLDKDVINWKAVEKKPDNTFKKGINCGEVIKACKKLKLMTTNIGGTDIKEGNKKLTAALVWQLMRHHYF